jgi:hypothetical protein
MEAAIQQLHHDLDHRQGRGRLLSLGDTRTLEKTEDRFWVFDTQGFDWINGGGASRGNQAGQQCQKTSTAATKVEKSQACTLKRRLRIGCAVATAQASQHDNGGYRESRASAQVPQGKSQTLGHGLGTKGHHLVAAFLEQGCIAELSFGGLEGCFRSGFLRPAFTVWAHPFSGL